MFYDYFHLDENPFKLNTDTRYLYLSEEHTRAIAYLDYAILNDENILALTGDIGAGKSLLVQNMQENLNDDVISVRIHQTQIKPIEFLQLLLLEVGIKSFHDRKIELLYQIKEFLISKFNDGLRVLLVIDEAQNLNKEVLEEIRFLADIEFNCRKLLNVFLVGQPELRKTLELPEMMQLKQRLRLQFHLTALKECEIKNYARHRLSIAGKNNDVKISGKCIPLIYLYTAGRPRLINILFDHALTCAFVNKKKTITMNVIENAIQELNWKPYVRT